MQIFSCVLEFAIIHPHSRRYMMDHYAIRQSQVADIIGITQGRVSQLLTAKAKLPHKMKRDMVRRS